jgi:hypothetical protein
MSFTRFNYDKARTKKRLDESTFTGKYFLNTPGNGTPQFYEDPHIRLQKWGGNLRNVECGNHPIDIETELIGRKRYKTRYGDKNIVQPIQTTKVKSSVVPAYTEETRVTHPAMMYRDKPHVRWEYPIHDPQLPTCMQFHNNISTRIIQKDTFIPKI